MRIGPRTVVLLEYTLKDDKGDLLDASGKGAPLEYFHGSGALIPGLEKALDGKEAGDTVAVSLTAEEGYGVRDERLIQNMPVRKLPEKNVEVGKQYRVRTPKGPLFLLVTAIRGDYATVDTNHPLAGKALHFAAKVIGVREATEEETAHGHIHGPGGHDH